MKNKAWFLAGALVMAPAAWASTCPALVHEIDQILAAKPEVDEETIVDEETNKSVKQLRDEGQRLHEQGKHGESVDTLRKALDLLKNVTG